MAIRHLTSTMRSIVIAAITITLGFAGGVAGGYVYERASSDSGDGVYCYNPEPGGVHLRGDPTKQVCVPTGR